MKLEVNVDDFYAAAPVAMQPAPQRAPEPARHHAQVWPWVAGAVAVVALIVGLAVVLWPHTSGSSSPDVPMARLFGQQTRLQLPQPVEPDDCAAAVKAFPKIAADATARAAFVDGCLHGAQ